MKNFFEHNLAHHLKNLSKNKKTFWNKAEPQDEFLENFSKKLNQIDELIAETDKKIAALVLGRCQKRD